MDQEVIFTHALRLNCHCFIRLQLQLPATTGITTVCLPPNSRSVIRDLQPRISLLFSRSRTPGSHFSPFCSRSGAADSGSGRMGSRLTTFHSRFGRICSRLATFCSEPGANSSEPGAKNRHLGAKSSQLARPEPQAAIRLAHRGHQTKRAGKPPPVVATGAALRPPGWPWACGCRGAAPTWPPAASSGSRPCRTSASVHTPARPPPSRRCPVR